jgi:hypothetical protein
MRLHALGAFALALVIGTAASAANLVQNGSFSANSTSGPTSASGYEVDGAFGDAGAVTGWTSAGGSTYNLYFYGNGSEMGGATGVDAASRWGEGGQRPDVNFTSNSPNGGAYMLLDGDPGFSGALSQNVTGLVVGQTYDLNFYWAGGELYNRTGYVSDQLHVTFGGDTQSTVKYFNTAAPGAPGSFSPWMKVTMAFTAHATTQTLSFLSDGAPGGNLPPVALLDGVSLGVPEPAAWTLMLLGFGGLGAVLRRRRRLAPA